MKYTNPKVSIVIPVYNGSNFLHEAIDSALAQTYNNIEVIVINDGSNDKGATEKIAKSYGNKISYYKKENGGVATALNLGIEKMTGEYFSWLSHDDLYAKTKIEDQVNYLNKNNREDVIIACNAKVLFANGIKKKQKIDANTFNFIDIFLSTSANVGVNGCSLLIPKKAFEVCGDFDVNLPVTQDYDLWFRMKDKFIFILLDKYLVVSRIHEMQDSVQKQSVMCEDGDQLHFNFLTTIPYERFDQYFRSSKLNISHAYENYLIYKARSYTKTAALLLLNILKYHYETNKNKFRSIFISEIEYNSTTIDIEQVWNQILSSDISSLPIKFARTAQEKNHIISSRIVQSIARDGIYFTGEKAVRMVYKKLRK